MKVKTLLPYNGSRCTGRLYDEPDADEATVNLSGKAIVTEVIGVPFVPIRKLIQVRLWTAEADFWTQLAIDARTHALVGSGSAKRENKAWDRLVLDLQTKGYDL